MKKFKRVFSFFMPALLISQFLSCSNSTSTDPTESIITNIPLIKGIVQTDSDTPTPISIWGVPNENSSITVQGTGTIYNEKSISLGQVLISYGLDFLFPNPANYSTTIVYELTQNANVSIWVVRGLTPKQLSVENTLYFNSYVVNNSDKFYIKLSEGFTRAGKYHLTWNLQDKQGNTIPDGFYRIFVNFDGNLLWRDLCVFHPKGNEQQVPTDVF